MIADFHRDDFPRMWKIIFGGTGETPEKLNISGVRLETPENLEKVHLSGMEPFVEVYDTLNEQLQLHELTSQDKKPFLLNWMSICINFIY